MLPREKEFPSNYDYHGGKLMGMVVRTNTMGINANNNLTKNNSSVSKNLEKLSSGFRINRAADDASGLAISEKMKAQIKALDTASANAQDGISLIQTAEGYLGEVHDMLNRMVELAEKSANGTYEVLKDETTGEAKNEAYGAGQTGVDRQALQDEMDQLSAEIDRIAVTANFNANKLLDGSLSEDNGGLVLQIGETSGDADKLTVSVKDFQTDKLFADLGDLMVGNEAAPADVGGGQTVDISNQTNASKAAEKLRTVINSVSSQRASLGAMQNRLEYTINNLNTASENMSSANSRIRDTDMAKTMMQYTQGNVLTQAAQAMLAQANQQPQGVLQLLQ